MEQSGLPWNDQTSSSVFFPTHINSTKKGLAGQFGIWEQWAFPVPVGFTQWPIRYKASIRSFVSTLVEPRIILIIIFVFYNTFQDSLKQISKPSLSPALGKKQIRGRKWALGQLYLEPMSLTYETYTNLRAPFSWVRVLWPFLMTRLSCCLRGDLVLGKGTQWLSPAGEDQEVTGTSPFPPPSAGSRSLPGRLTSLNHSISSNNNSSICSESGQLLSRYTHVWVLGSTWTPCIISFSLLCHRVHSSSTTPEPSLFFLYLKKLLPYNFLESRVHCKGIEPRYDASDSHTDTWIILRTFSEVGKCRPL